MKRKRSHYYLIIFAVVMIQLMVFPSPAMSAPADQQADNPNPPDHVVRLIFIHHSTGENWLRDDYGGLGQALADNNYFVSDTNYGWGPNSIGDRTDIPNWLEWFASSDTPAYMDALYAEDGQNSSYTRLEDNPGGENEIILFKSCFPNSALEGNPTDPPSADGWLTVGHAKFVYNSILPYFGAHPEKLFVVVTAPPLQDATYANNARAFNQWLVNDWLNENDYPLSNVAVFDFFNVLTGANNHHRFKDGKIEDSFVPGQNKSHYPSSRSDDHPSETGSRKATDEFLPLLNIFYHRWKEGQASPQPLDTQPMAATQPYPSSTLSNQDQEISNPTPGSAPKGLPCVGSILFPSTLIGITWALIRKNRS